MHIYFLGVLVSLLIVAVTFFVKLRRLKRYKKVYEVTMSDVFFALICVSASWATVIVFIVMCIKSDFEHLVIKKI